jgi:predicted TIM-barrel fold metal-dependent hydrolase
VKEFVINRRQFISAAAAASTASLLAQQSYEWGGPALDIHLHLRADGESNVAHINGSGVTKAILLTRVESVDQSRTLAEKHPGRFVWFVSADVTKPESAALLTKAVKDGALGLGEIKNKVECDGPEMKRMYALAADLNVPIQIHFGDVPQASGNAVFNGGFKRFDAMLKAFPRTKFIAHADTFWANVSSDYAYDTAYPSGPIKPGGISDNWLSDHPHLWADMSANSCNNFLNRDPEFTSGFLARHQDKLMFGCDCSCSDGRGGGNTNPRHASTGSALRARRWRPPRGCQNRRFSVRFAGKTEGSSWVSRARLKWQIAFRRCPFVFLKQNTQHNQHTSADVG